MLINLTDFFAEEGRNAVMDVPFEVTEISSGGEKYPVTEASAIHLTIRNDGKGRVVILAAAQIGVELRCDRCLGPVKKVFDLNAETAGVAPEIATEEDLDEQCMFIDGYQLNTDDLICNEIFTCWPMKILCRENCKGLCTVCGKDLNEGECGCDTFVPDPRMAAIMDIFKENKEV